MCCFAKGASEKEMCCVLHTEKCFSVRSHKLVENLWEKVKEETQMVLLSECSLHHVVGLTREKVPGHSWPKPDETRLVVGVCGGRGRTLTTRMWRFLIGLKAADISF